MKTNLKTLLAAGGLMFGSGAFAQTIDMNLLTDESDVTVTMDLQPVLQIQMSTPDQINFTFNTINSYMAGITHYGATVIRVSSTVDWDLVAVGTSSDNEANQTKLWDNPVQYSSANSVNQLNGVPISSLELYQIPPNPIAGANTDYSSPYVINPGSGAIATSINAVEVGNQSAGTSVTFQNTTDARVIAGSLGAAFAGDPGVAMAPGSALSTLGQSYNPGDFKYTISYRIVPGLPAVFPLRDIDDATLAGAPDPANNEYVAPGVYTMEVRYILTEDQ